MKKFVVIFLTASALVSCKMADKRSTSPTGPVSDIGGLKVPERKDFSAPEIIIGKRICAAFKYKREKMAKLTDMAEKFSFTGQYKACNDTAVTLAPYGVSISISSADLRYIPDTANTKSFHDVLTDESEPIATLCTNLTASATVSNLIISTHGSNYFIKLYNISGYDTYEIATMSKSSKGSYSLVSTQSVGVITSVSPNYEIRLSGIEKYRTLNSTCSGSKDYTSLGHTWGNATTAYKLPNE